MQFFYQDDFVTLINGDSFQVLQNLKIKFNSIVTDPPYAINFQNNHWDSAQFDLIKYKTLFHNILQSDGNLIMFQGWSNVSNVIQNYNNFKLKNWVIWDRIKGRGAKTNFVSTRQDILWFVKDQKKYTFNPMLSNIKKKTGGSIGKRNGCQYRKLSNVWYDISPIVPWSKQRVDHPTQKPIQLLQRIISVFTNQNQIVLDPFAGSGTTAIACKRLNRKCVLIEKEEKYCNIIVDRLKEV